MEQLADAKQAAEVLVLQWADAYQAAKQQTWKARMDLRAYLRSPTLARAQVSKYQVRLYEVVRL